jgi:hypothetical protein
MRDDSIFRMQAVNVRRDALILDQWMFLETRQRAIESVLCSLRIRDRIILLFRPSEFKDIVDKVHLALLNDAKVKRDSAVSKAKEESTKPKLTIVKANGFSHA